MVCCLCRVQRNNELQQSPVLGAGCCTLPQKHLARQDSERLYLPLTLHVQGKE